MVVADIDRPAVISFSGGRTSGYMLRRCLEAFGGALPADVHVLFGNTGKERPETLDFVEECGRRWGVLIRWLEYRAAGSHVAEVNHKTASRQGEPFAALIERRNYLPNPVTRFCTQELKIRPMRDWMRAQGYEHWTNVVGIRADEPRRVARMKDPGRKAERWDIALPLADAGVTLAEVDAFWASQPFDLRLHPWEGNCDLCFLKGYAKKIRIIEDRPDLANWWVEREREIGAGFRKDQPSYEQMVRQVTRQPRLPLAEADGDDSSGLIDCLCGD